MIDCTQLFFDSGNIGLLFSHWYQPGLVVTSLKYIFWDEKWSRPFWHHQQHNINKKITCKETKEIHAKTCKTPCDCWLINLHYQKYYLLIFRISFCVSLSQLIFHFLDSLRVDSNLYSLPWRKIDWIMILFFYIGWVIDHRQDKTIVKILNLFSVPHSLFNFSWWVA